MKQTARALMMAVLLCGVVAAIPTPPASAQDCPELLGSWPYGPAWGVAVAGTRAYVGSGRALMVVDVSNPAAPALVGSDDTFGLAARVSLSGGLAVLAGDGRCCAHRGRDVVTPGEPGGHRR